MTLPGSGTWPRTTLPVLLLLHGILSTVGTTCTRRTTGTNCLPSLLTQPSLYESCKTTPCFLFLRQPPFTIPPDPLPAPPHTPFPCSAPAPYAGLSFAIHNNTLPALCVYAGEDCSAADLMSFTAQHEEYQFGITGLMIHTPERLCFHNPATPIIEDFMVIVGEAAQETPLDKLIRPFSPWTWVVFATALLLILVVAFVIARITRGKPSMITTLFVATGHSSAVLRKTVKREEQHALLTKYSLSMTLLKLSIGVLVTLLALFYEAGVVNFLFQENTVQLGKRVRALSASELAKYAVLRDSALEQVWNLTVNPDGNLYDARTEQPPWRRCRTAEDCVSWVLDSGNPVSFDVTFDAFARVWMNENGCKLATFQTKDILYQFTGGWMYNRGIPDDYRREMDRVLVGLRINRTVGNIIDAYRAGNCENGNQLGAVIVAVPIAVLVLPPLLASALILFWDRRKAEKGADK